MASSIAEFLDGLDVQSVAAEILEKGASVGQSLTDMNRTVEEIDKQIKAQVRLIF